MTRPWAVMLVLLVLAAVAARFEGAENGSGGLSFTAAEGGEYPFDTGILKGTLRAGGQSIGLAPLIHLQTGTSLSKGTGLFNHYRVFTRGRRYGYGARQWPSTAALRQDGSVEVVWAKTDERPFELRAVYRWAAPNVLDLETTAHAEAVLQDFEVFLASYFETSFSESRVSATKGPGGRSGPLFVTVDKAVAEWQAFPRDAEAVRVIEDGRWALPPSPLEWTVMAPFDEPVASRRDPTSNLVVVMLSERKECFSVSTPYGTEPHFSTYMSLFGRDLKPGETAHAHSRLVILHNPTEADIRGIAAAYRKARSER